MGNRKEEKAGRLEGKKGPWLNPLRGASGAAIQQGEGEKEGKRVRKEEVEKMRKRESGKGK